MALPRLRHISLERASIAHGRLPPEAHSLPRFCPPSMFRCFFSGVSLDAGVIGHNTVTGAASASSAVRMAMTAETKKVKDLTLVFCRRVADCGTKEILLGKKKRGFGLGKWNGEDSLRFASYKQR